MLPSPSPVSVGRARSAGVSEGGGGSACSATSGRLRRGLGVCASPGGRPPGTPRCYPRRHRFLLAALDPRGCRREEAAQHARRPPVAFAAASVFVLAPGDDPREPPDATLAVTGFCWPR